MTLFRLRRRIFTIVVVIFIAVIFVTLYFKCNRNENNVLSKSVGVSYLEKLSPNLPTIYAITATHRKYEQRAELVRLCNTLIRVPNIYWIVVEDASMPSSLVYSTLVDCGVPFTHLYAITPDGEKPLNTEPYWFRPKGVHQRNRAFDWLRAHQKQGVMYIADDDNTYHVRLFAEMRWTKTVSVWPVALVGGLPYEGIECRDGKVLRFIVAYKPKRPFPLDMAGFAVNLDLLHSHPEARLRYNVERGYQESILLSGLGVTMQDLEAKAEDCSKILVWHTRTQTSKINNIQRLAKLGLTLPKVVDY